MRAPPIGLGMWLSAIFVAGHTICSSVWKATPLFILRFVMMMPTTTCKGGRRGGREAGKGGERAREVEKDEEAGGGRKEIFLRVEYMT